MHNKQCVLNNHPYLNNLMIVVMQNTEEKKAQESLLTGDNGLDFENILKTRKGCAGKNVIYICFAARKKEGHKIKHVGLGNGLIVVIRQAGNEMKFLHAQFIYKIDTR